MISAKTNSTDKLTKFRVTERDTTDKIETNEE